MKIVDKRDVIKKILVLSDLHINKDDIIINGKVIDFNNFQKEMERYVSMNPFDYLIFAGDLTNKHDVNGYAALKNLVNAIKLKNSYENHRISGNDNIITCPGNHDQFRNRLDSIFGIISEIKTNEIERDIHRIIPMALLKFASDESKSNYFFQSIKKIHSEKFERFLTEWIDVVHDGSIYRDQRREPGYTLNFGNLLFTSINSAWFCDFPDHRVNDEGHLILGINYVKKAMEVPRQELLDSSTEKIPRIVIMHHPPESFRWEEVYNPDPKMNTFNYLTNNSSLIISGHVHGVPRTLGFDQNAYLISNGTSFNADLQMSFTSLELNVNTGNLIVNKNIFKTSGKGGLEIVCDPNPQKFIVPFVEKKDLTYC
jgi:predicted MPP superfamily phosphohydrolase